MATSQQIQKIGQTWDRIAMRLGLRRPVSELAEVLTPLSTGVLSGLFAGYPTTPCSQATGAVPASIRFNLWPGMIKVDGALFTSPDPDPMVDYPIPNDPPVLTVGQGAYGVVLFGLDRSVEPPSHQMVAVWAAPFDDEPIYPTHEDVLAALEGYSFIDKYARMFMIGISRTGDTSVSVWIDNTTRDA